MIDIIKKMLEDNKSILEIHAAIDAFLLSLNDTNWDNETTALVNGLLTAERGDLVTYVFEWKPKAATPATKQAALPHINTQDEKGNTQLHREITIGNSAAALSLIETGADVTLANSYGETALLIAVQYSLTSVVAKLLTHSDVKKMFTITTIDGWTLLHIAARYDNLTVAKKAIEFGLDVNTTKSDKWTPLHLVVSNKKYEMIDLLLTQNIKASINAKNCENHTPLQIAFFNEDIATMIKLINHGADFSGKFGNNNQNLLRWAVDKNAIDLIAAIVKNSAPDSVTFTTKFGDANYTIMHLAAKNGWTSVIEATPKVTTGNLLNRRNTVEMTPLHVVAMTGDVDTAKLLIQHGANVNAKAMLGTTVLYYATKHSRSGMVDLLLAQNNIQQSLNTSNSEDGKTPLQMAFYLCDIPTMIKLINAGADFSGKFGDNKKTLLAWAIERLSDELICAMIRNNKKDSDIFSETFLNGYNIFHHAARSGMFSVIDDCVKFGPNTLLESKTADGSDALIIAVYHCKKISVVQKLLELGMNPCSTNNHGYSALDLALDQKTYDVANLLLDQPNIEQVINKRKVVHIIPLLFFVYYDKQFAIVKKMIAIQGVDLNATDNNGSTLLHQAVKDGQNEIVAALLARGANAELANKEGKAALRIAIENNQTVAASLLISHMQGNNTNHSNENDNFDSLAMVALNQGNSDMLASLLSANIRFKFSEELILRQRIKNNSMPDAIKSVLKRIMGMETNAEALQRNEDLIKAIWKDLPDRVSNFLALVADPNFYGFYIPSGLGGRFKNFVSGTPIPDPDYCLHHAIKNGKSHYYKPLLEAGADPRLTNKKDGRSALHCAVNNAQGEIDITAVQALIDSKYINDLINARDNNGQTALSDCLLYLQQASIMNSQKKMQPTVVKDLIINLLDCGAKLFEQTDDASFKRIQILLGTCNTESKDMQRLANRIIEEAVIAQQQGQANPLSWLIKNLIDLPPVVISSHAVYNQFLVSVTNALLRNHEFGVLDTKTKSLLIEKGYEIPSAAGYLHPTRQAESQPKPLVVNAPSNIVVAEAARRYHAPYVIPPKSTENLYPTFTDTNNNDRPILSPTAAPLLNAYASSAAETAAKQNYEGMLKGLESIQEFKSLPVLAQQDKDDDDQSESEYESDTDSIASRTKRKTATLA